MATLLPGFSDAPGSISIRCRPPGLNVADSPGARRSSGTARMRLTPSTTRVSCISTSPNAALLAPVIVSGFAHGFSMRPKPAIIGIAAGGRRTQPSTTFRVQSAAEAADDAAIIRASRPSRIVVAFMGL